MAEVCEEQEANPVFLDAASSRLSFVFGRFFP